MELSAGTAAGVSAPEWKAMSEETFFFYWGCVSTAKEENSAGSMMAADNQKVVWIFFFFFCFLPSEGFLAAASLCPGIQTEVLGPAGICRVFDFCSTALTSTECLDRNSFARTAGPQGSLLC